MKKSGIIHPELIRVLAELGHGHQICIADAGLPIPQNVERIDLAYRFGSPSFVDVLEALSGELVVEQVTVANEAKDHCPEIVSALHEAFPEAEERTVAHEQFKRETGSIRAIIRSGEVTPYANAMLRSGVPFS